MIGFDARPIYINGWLVGVVGFGGMLLGFWFGALRNRRYRVLQCYLPRAARLETVRWASLLFGGIGVASWFIGGAQGVGGSFANYLQQFANCIIVYIVLAYSTYQRRSAMLVVAVLAPLILWVYSLAMIGFRGPILIGLMALYFCYHLLKNRRPNLFLAVSVVFIMLVLSGAFVMARSYYSGLDFAKLGGAGWRELVLNGLADTVTFSALSSVVAYVPAVAGFSYFDMFWYTLTFPIPRSLYPGKGIAEYIYIIQDAVGAAAQRENQGMAVPNVGEYYLAFGWPGVFCLSALLGWFCAWMWRWYLARRCDPLAVIAYGAFCGWTFQVIHRGYLPSSAMSLCFMVLLPILGCRWAEYGIVPIEVSSACQLKAQRSNRRR